METDCFSEDLGGCMVYNNKASLTKGMSSNQDFCCWHHIQKFFY